MFLPQADSSFSHSSTHDLSQLLLGSVVQAANRSWLLKFVSFNPVTSISLVLFFFPNLIIYFFQFFSKYISQDWLIAKKKKKIDSKVCYNFIVHLTVLAECLNSKDVFLLHSRPGIQTPFIYSFALLLSPLSWQKGKYHRGAHGSIYEQNLEMPVHNSLVTAGSCGHI